MWTSRRIGAFVLAVAAAAVTIDLGCGPRSRSGDVVILYSGPSGPPGSWSRDFLARDRYDDLVVQVDAVEGEQLSSVAVDLLVQTLGERCDKPGGVRRVEGRTLARGQHERWSLDDLAAAERSTRTAFAAGRTAAIHILSVDGPSDRDTPDAKLSGVSYGGTSIAIFHPTLVGTSGSLVGIESATLVHEAGHLLGLVGLGAPLTSAHGDPNHVWECGEPSCVMFFQVPHLTSELTIATDFGPGCRGDLRANGGK